MMLHMHLEEMQAATKGQLIYPKQSSEEQLSLWKDALPTGIVTDNREITENGVFAAIRGERVDAHRFVQGAFQSGALLCIVEETPEDFLSDGEDLKGPVLLVPSVVTALQQLAEYYRSTLTIPIIGIIGSVGKTSTKEMVASVLSQKFNTLKTKGNQNNAIGLPLTIFRIDSETEAAVVEMGISKFNEMHVLGQMAKPNFVVMTNIGTCHLEDLIDRDGVFRAKTEVFDHLPDQATLVLNGDDDHLSTVEHLRDASIFHYGVENEENQIKATEVTSLGMKGMEATFSMTENEETITFPVTINLPGPHNVMNALAAATVGRKLGLSIEEIQKGIASATTIAGRSNFLENEDLTIIDDCYNANPMSMKASLQVLSFAFERKIAVLGDMGELGTNEKRYHFEVGEAVAQNHIDELVAVGPLSEEMCRGAKASGMKDDHIHHFEDVDSAISFLTSQLQPKDSILVKASHYMNFTKIVNALKDIKG